MKKNYARNVVLHILVWFVFVSLPFIFNPRRPDGAFSSLLNELVTPMRLSNALYLILIFYLTYYITIPYLYFRHKYFLFVLSLPLTLAGLAGVNVLLSYASSPAHSRGLMNASFTAFGPDFNLFMLLIVLIAAFATRIYSQYRLVTEEKLSAEISFLKAQISPHFLFNTLNSIYALALTKSDRTSEAVARLSGMLRYAYDGNHEQMAMLKDELSYIENYINLQKMRLPENAQLRYTINGQPNDHKIAPFLLITFIENAFKYGVNEMEKTEIRIKIDIATNGDLEMLVANRKVFSQTSTPDDNTRLGISNTRRRLDLLYPGKHSLLIEEDNGIFAVTLDLELR